MYRRIEIGYKSRTTDILGMKKREDIENFLNISVRSIRTRRVYTIDAELNEEEIQLVKKELLVDPITEEANAPRSSFDWLIEVGYRPGVTDNVGNTAKKAIRDLLNKDIGEDEGVYVSTQYLIEGKLR